MRVLENPPQPKKFFAFDCGNCKAKLEAEPKDELSNYRIPAFAKETFCAVFRCPCCHTKARFNRVDWTIRDEDSHRGPEPFILWDGFSHTDED